MFAAELDHPRFDEFDLSTLRTGVMAGAPCPIALMKRVVEKMHLSEITDSLRNDRDRPGKLPKHD